VQEDQLKYKETIVEGFDKLPAAVLGLIEGTTSGK
jgi:NADPH-dependent curcumin reductase CurA